MSIKLIQGTFKPDAAFAKSAKPAPSLPAADEGVMPKKA